MTAIIKTERLILRTWNKEEAENGRHKSFFDPEPNFKVIKITRLSFMNAENNIFYFLDAF